MLGYAWTTSSMQMDCKNCGPDERGDDSLPTQEHDSLSNGSPSQLSPELPIWLVSAATSITTTRHLLNHGLHYPYHLLLVHLLVAAIVDFGAYSHHIIRHGSKLALRRQGARLPNIELPWQFLYVLCMAGTWICGYQALLHLPSTTTLMMTMTIDWRPELALGLSSDRVRKQREIRYIVFAVGLLAIFLADYRLYPNGVVFALACQGFSGLARLIPQCGTQISCSSQRLEFTVLLGSTALTPILLAMWLYENPRHSYIDLTGMLGLFVTSLCASGAALSYGHNLFTQLAPRYESASHDGIDLDNPVCRTIASVLLTGLVCFIDAMLGPPTLSSWWQLAGYSVGSVALLDREDMKPAVRGLKHLHIDRNALTMRKCTAAGRSETLGNSDNGLTLSTSQPTKKRPCRAANLSRPLWLILLIGCVAWPMVIYRTAYEGPPPAADRISVYDAAYTPSRDLDLVIARYDEPLEHLATLVESMLRLPNIAPLQPNIFVYNKHPVVTDSDFENAMAIRFQNMSHFTVEHRRNVGREGETYLSHIIEHWDDLARHTMFVQTDVHDRWSILQRVKDYFVPDTGFLSLSYAGELCHDCERCTDRAGWIGHSDVLNEIYRRANRGSQCKDLVMTYKGQFVASAARMRGNSKEMYQWLLQQLTNPSSTVHRPEFWNTPQNWDRVDSLQDPVFGFTLERMWGAIMQCSELRVAYRCPSLMSGLRGRYSPLQHCQCLDNKT